MYHLDDLPFKINKKDPLSFYTQFRQQIETREIKVRNLVPMPQQGSLGNFNENFSQFLNIGEIPTVKELLALGNNEQFFDSPYVIVFSFLTKSKEFSRNALTFLK